MSKPQAPALTMRGEADFQHGDDTLKLAFDVTTLMMVEAETGIGFMALQNHWGELRLQASLLRHGLAKGSSDLTLSYAEAAELWLVSDAAKVAVLEAFNGFLPTAKEGSDAGNPPQAAGNGAGKKS